MATAGIITLDLHGKNCRQAQVAIDAQLRRAKAGIYRLRLIHGNNQGTALRDMIRSNYDRNSRVIRLDCSQAGTTDLVLREF